MATNSANEFWIVTTYFNSQRYVSRLRNYNAFIAAVSRAGVPCMVIECAFGHQPFELPESGEAARVVRCRSFSVLWQKERLLNLALDALPVACRKVAWIDADVLFEDPAWALTCCRLLEEHPVVQLFESVARLPKGIAECPERVDQWEGFCSRYVREPTCVRSGWSHHGHTGFAWAARRSVLERCRFFDLSLAGSGDHLMAHGFAGDFDSHCVKLMIGIDTPLHREYVSWAHRAYSLTRGKLGFLPGRALHLWHGELQRRKYYQRGKELRALNFSPNLDVRIGSEGCWEWTGANAALERWAEQVFADRCEDE